MSKFKTLTKLRLAMFIGAVGLVLILIWPSLGNAQDKLDKTKVPDPHAQHQEQPPDRDQDMSVQMQESAWWFDNYSRRLKQEMAGKEMAQGEGGSDGRTDMIDDKMDTGSITEDSPSSFDAGLIGDVDMTELADDDIEMMGVVAFGDAGSESAKGGIGEMQMASSLPGSPGVSHVYHIGATGFFLNHPEHIALSIQQQAALNQIKQNVLLSKSTIQRKIDEAEQELWALTGADEPDAAQIEAKVQTIGRLRGEQRMAFIQSVGEAVKVLTEEQTKILLGTAAPVISDSE